MKSTRSMRRAGALPCCLAAAMVLGWSPADAAPSAKPLRITVIDVEGGTAILFVTPEGKSLLVDTGWPTGLGGAKGAPPPPPSADRIVAAAKAAGVTRIDTLLITHYHIDHIGGIHDLAAHMPIGRILDHGANQETLAPGAQGAAIAPATTYPAYATLAAAHNRHSIVPGESLSVGTLKIQFVDAAGKVTPAPLAGGGAPTPGCDTMPDKAQDGGLENAMSAGFVATYGTARILMLGDSTWNMEKKLVCPINRIGPIDLLLVSHHGSSLSSSPQLLAATAPRVAVMNNGAHKGGDAAVLQTVRDAPSHPAFWQLHQPVKSPELAAPEAQIANLETPDDAGNPLNVTISAYGTITVANPRNGFHASYPARTPNR